MAIPHTSLARLRAEAADRRACHLWKDAAQSVFGKITPIHITAAGRSISAAGARRW